MIFLSLSLDNSPLIMAYETDLFDFEANVESAVLTPFFSKFPKLLNFMTFTMPLSHNIT